MSSSRANGGEPRRAGDSRPEPARRAPPYLDFETSTSGHGTYQLDKEVTRIGRQKNNDIQILESHVSRHHAEIARRGDRFVIAEAGSLGGVFVNGTKVTEQPLADGDVITLGLSDTPRFVFRDSDETTTRPSAGSILSSLVSSEGGPRLEHLARFLEFGRLLGGGFSLAEVLENVVDLATEITGAERGFLILRGEDGSLDFSVARMRDGTRIPREKTLVSETIVREALATGTKRIVSDIRNAEDLAGLNSVMELNLGSAVALPLHLFAVHEGGVQRSRSGDEVYGVLYLDSREPQGALTRIDRGILESLARDASSVIENARLYRETVEKRRIEAEMERAREVQTALLPQSFWADAHFEVSGCCVPSHRLGGDYLEQVRLVGGEPCFVIADVVGKGLPAALLAAAVQGALAAESATDQPLGRMVERLNRATCRLAPEGKFVTLLCCTLSGTGELTYVNAGHPPANVVTPAGEVRHLSTGGMALGIRESNRYTEGRLDLSPGEVVALFTDGVTEAVDPDGSLFGESRLEGILKASAALPAARIEQTVLSEVESFSGQQLPRDDITLLVLKYLGDGEHRKRRHG